MAVEVGVVDRENQESHTSNGECVEPDPLVNQRCVQLHCMYQDGKLWRSGTTGRLTLKAIRIEYHSSKSQTSCFSSDLSFVKCFFHSGSISSKVVTLVQSVILMPANPLNSTNATIRHILLEKTERL